MNINSMNSVSFKGHVDLLTPMGVKYSDETQKALTDIKKAAEQSSPENYTGIMTVRPAKKDNHYLMISMYDTCANGPYDDDKEYLSLKGYSAYMPVDLSSDKAKDVKNMILEDVAKIYGDN